MIIYKYLDNRGVDLLENLRIRVTPPNQFNDPFEFTPVPPENYPASKAKRQLKDKQTLLKVYNEYKLQENYRGNFKDFRKSIREDRESFAKDLAEMETLHIKDECEAFLDKASKEVGLICFSREPDNILMWSHYAEQHKGFVVGFDPGPKFLNASNVYDVDYSEQRVLAVPDPRPNDSRTLENIKKLVRTKSDLWAYEAEIRAVFLLNYMSPEKDGHYYHKFPCTMIKRVILGYRFTPDLRKRIESAITKNNIQLQLERMTIAKKTFGLVSVPAIPSVL